MPRTRTSSATELLVNLRRDDRTPLHSQLEQELRTAIRSGRVASEAVLPSTRALAGELGLSRGVVVEAYEQLVAEGYLTSHAGGTTRVGARVADPQADLDAKPDDPPFRIDFRYGRPDVSQFPRQAWLRSLRRVLNEAPNDRLSYLDHRGALELREALASYLNRVRATAATADRIVVCNGFAQGIGLVMHAIKAAGGKRVAVEEPGQVDAGIAARFAGLEPVPVPVDDDGIVVEALERARADAVIVTPAHHFPTGAVLSPERRAALVAWARARNGVILEDDYDAEYRYDREPIGATQGLAPEHVIYAGSASKTLAPGLRLGWLIAPTRLVDELAEIKETTDRGTASIEQLAFADFLGRGEFDRHLRRMRPIYRARRARLLRGLRRHLPELRPIGPSAGLHVVTWLPPDVAESAILERLGALGVAITGVARFSMDERGPGGLLFGFGMPSEREIDEGIELVGQALADVRGSAGRAARPTDSVDRRVTPPAGLAISLPGRPPA
jgi:GntR family transcriptional regulator/MocR family aminotransferase